MTSLAKLRQKLLTDPEVKAEYDRLGPILAVVGEMIEARLAAGLTVQGGTSTGRAVRNNCDVTRALPELLGTARVDSCDITEKWSTSFRGLASYTVPKVDVLISASMRSIETSPGGVATTGLSLAANYVVPNTIIAQSLGRLPANALATGTTTVNLLNPGQLYVLDRINLVDMRFAKIFKFGGRRADVGIDSGHGHRR